MYVTELPYLRRERVCVCVGGKVSHGADEKGVGGEGGGVRSLVLGVEVGVEGGFGLDWMGRWMGREVIAFFDRWGFFLGWFGEWVGGKGGRREV